MVISGTDFVNSTDLSCKIGPFWSTSVVLYNSTTIECTFGKILLAEGDGLPLTISFNGIELASIATVDDEIIEVTAAEIPTAIGLDPALVFYGETDIEVLIESSGLLETDALSCKVGLLIISGEFIEEEVEVKDSNGDVETDSDGNAVTELV
mmetsp:Transcript_135/g.111  ORF Transcript_135/g.111 Transcript_135/m.111 type:complete len:152 (-) Transcript_135:8333-8788(-)